MAAALLGGSVVATQGSSQSAVAAPVGQGFPLSPGDLAFILDNIKIAEAHVANTTSETGPCGALLGQGEFQLATPFVSEGLRTVDGSCNNLTTVAGYKFGATGTVFPRHTPAQFLPADAGTSYAQTSLQVVDAEPRMVSNLISDQTFTNPAAVQVAGFPFRSQGNTGVVPCTIDPHPGDIDGTPNNCVPSYETLSIPNITTDIGLSPPYNGLFALFGQFFDHGIDQTVKTPQVESPSSLRDRVFMPLAADDPLVAGPNHIFGDFDDLPPALRFMTLPRGKDRPNTLNTNSSWVDQSQTYTSHASHQVFLRSYVNNGLGRPVSNGYLLNGTVADSMGTWNTLKAQAASMLGLQLADIDALNVPMIATDLYGNFVPGPDRGLPMYVTATGYVEGDTTAPVPVPGNVLYFDIPFLTDIAHDSNPAAPGYNAAKLGIHVVAGDGRANENIGLQAIHQIFHSEHNRLVDQIKSILVNDTTDAGIAALAEWQLGGGLGAGVWNGGRLFQAARFVNEMQYQHLVFEEFARKIQPGIDLFSPRLNIDASVRAEFAHAVYRFGHSMLTDSVDRINNDGSRNDIALLDGFLNPAEFYDNGALPGDYSAKDAAGAIIMGMADQPGQEIDEFITETLRNNLLGLPLDLGSLNMARARSEGVPPLNVFRRQLFNQTGDQALAPYTSWFDFGQGIKHDASLINFVAAYGTHPTILNNIQPGVDGLIYDDTGTIDDETLDNVISDATLASRRVAAGRLVDPAVGDPNVPPDYIAFMNSIGSWANAGANSTTGLDAIDLWIGGLAEQTVPFGGHLGSTFNFVFEQQMVDLQDGDRLYYLERNLGTNLLSVIEGSSFAELFMRNTNAHSLKDDAFSTADCKFQLANLAGTPAGFASFGNNVANDPGSDCEENLLLVRQPDGTIQYRATNSVDPPGINGQAVYNGTDTLGDRARGGNDNDTFWGGEGADRFEGGSGSDVALGGEGRDIITDSAGDDVPRGGPGNDAINAGPGLDVLFGGEGADFLDGGANGNETFAGPDNDLVISGQGPDEALGDGGDDWIEGGDQGDTLQGDSGSPFFLDVFQRAGHDVLLGQNGEDRIDGEGGDDVIIAGADVDRLLGAGGYDWSIVGASIQGDTGPAKIDLTRVLVPVGNPLDTFDRYLLIEAASGGAANDEIRGDDVVPADLLTGAVVNSDTLNQAGVNRLPGLNAIMPSGATAGGAVWGAGNILLGGSGSDILEGRGADDIIDGDRFVNVRLSVRSTPSDPGTQYGTASLLTQLYQLGNPNTMRADLMSGALDPANVVLVREVISSPNIGDVDTVVFSGPRSQYTVTVNPGSVTVTDDVALPVDDGTDLIYNAELLQFSDQVVDLADITAPTVTSRAPNSGAEGVALDSNVTAAFSEDVIGVDGTTFTLRQGTAANGTLVPATVTYDSVNHVATLNPTGNLTLGFVYTARLLPGISDGLIGLNPVTWTFTTGGAGPPIVTSTTPAANATAVLVGSDVTATFSEVVTGVAGATFTLRQGAGAAGALVGATVNYNSATNIATLNPNSDLLPNTLYTARLLDGIQDVTLEGLTPVTWSFTTGTQGAPAVLARTPAINAAAVAVGNNITATFSENVAGITGATFEVRQGTTVGGALVGAVVSYNSATRIATLNPNANLAPGTVYTARLLPGITDVDSANPLLSITPLTWSFTTGGNAPPTVSARVPGPGAIGVSRTANITATFSENVNGIGGATFTLRQGTLATGTLIARAVSYNNGTLVATLNPNITLLPNTVYTVRLLTGITDNQGAALVPVTWSFTTGAT